MRRRTADFLQGIAIEGEESDNLLTIASPPESETRERGKGEKDGEWTHFQGPRKLRSLLILRSIKNADYIVTLTVQVQLRYDNAFRL